MTDEDARAHSLGGPPGAAGASAPFDSGAAAPAAPTPTEDAHESLGITAIRELSMNAEIGAYQPDSDDGRDNRPCSLRSAGPASSGQLLDSSDVD